MQTQNQPEFGDPIDQDEAARLAGRSRETIRRWRRDQRLTSRLENGVVVVSRARVLAIARDLAAQGQVGGESRQPPRSPTPHVDDLRGVITDLREQRDRACARADRLERDLAGVRRQLADKDERVAALERELNGGVRGLLARRVRQTLGRDR